MQHEEVVLSSQGNESDELLKNTNLEKLHAQKLRHRNRSRRHGQLYGEAVEKADMNAVNAMKILDVAIIDDEVIEQNGVDRYRLRGRHHDSDATDAIGDFTGNIQYHYHNMTKVAIDSESTGTRQLVYLTRHQTCSQVIWICCTK